MTQHSALCRLKFTLAVVAALANVCSNLSTRAQSAPCAFDDRALSFAGTPLEQAQCLLRPVKIRGQLGAPLKKLPAPLEKLIGRDVSLSKQTLQSYLSQHRINESDIGGAISDPVSRANSADMNSPLARYFVIHDVSTPNYLDQPFPPDINERSWAWNDLFGKWIRRKVTHVYINRAGDSVTAVDFKSALPEPYYGTKFARDRLKIKNKGLVLHVELVQPRRRDPAAGADNDAIAPMPGFTQAQLDRLALVYVAASVRRGQWLIPSFHAAMDAGIADAHDDPQNFDLELWAKRLKRLLKDLRES